MNTSENLIKLADHIEANMPQQQLDMRRYCQDENGEDVPYVSKNSCGTTRCALGESPNVEGLEPVTSDFICCGISLRRIKYGAYGMRVYPALFHLTGAFKGMTNDHWEDVFSQNLSSDKVSVVQRLRDKAEELAE